jgi:hypothetical protein
MGTLAFTRGARCGLGLGGSRDGAHWRLRSGTNGLWVHEPQLQASHSGRIADKSATAGAFLVPEVRGDKPEHPQPPFMSL